jgi:hypothetical protein
MALIIGAALGSDKSARWAGYWHRDRMELLSARAILLLA